MPSGHASERTIARALVVGAVVALAGAGCGRVWYDPIGGEPADGATGDAVSGACDPRAPFGPPVLLGELSGSASSATLRLRPDELSGYYWSDRSGDVDVYLAERSAIGQPFTTRALVGLNSTAVDLDPGVTADGSAVTFATLRGGSFDLYEAAVGASADVFLPPTPVAMLNSSGADNQPYHAGSHVYFSSDRSGESRLYVAPRLGLASYGAPVELAELSLAGSDQFDPAVTPDELTIYWRSDRPGGAGAGDVYRATRSSPTVPFGAITLLPEPSSPAIDGPSSISADECRLYLSSDRAGAPAIYVATRP